MGRTQTGERYRHRIPMMRLSGKCSAHEHRAPALRFPGVPPLDGCSALANRILKCAFDELRTPVLTYVQLAIRQKRDSGLGHPNRSFDRSELIPRKSND